MNRNENGIFCCLLGGAYSSVIVRLGLLSIACSRPVICTILLSL